MGHERVPIPGDYSFGVRVLASSLGWPDHAPGCEATPVYRDGVDDPVTFIVCCDERSDCPTRARDVARYRELAERHGW